MSHKDEAETMTLVDKIVDDADTEGTVSTSRSIEPDSSLEKEMLDYLANSSAIFKSQQKDDPELSYNEKRTIAADQLRKSRAMFLAKFGKYLKNEHLICFEENSDDYEIRHHINQLKRYFNVGTRQIDVKNRRYQALKMLVEKGEYFSETEMMKRNPLLYENLVGRFLTEEQKNKRDNIDTTSITFVNLLLESIERDRLKNVKKAQKEAEDEEISKEYDSNDDSDNEEDEERDTDDACKSHWGEISKTVEPPYFQTKGKRARQIFDDVPFGERQILREEFVSHMYENFLNGKDIDFDYSTVDDNEIYDNLDMRNHDEEEKYFDSESPETVLVENVQEENNSEDELEIYMKSLKVK